MISASLRRRGVNGRPRKPSNFNDANRSMTSYLFLTPLQTILLFPHISAPFIHKRSHHSHVALTVVDLAPLEHSRDLSHRLVAIPRQHRFSLPHFLFFSVSPPPLSRHAPSSLLFSFRAFFLSPALPSPLFFFFPLPSSSSLPFSPLPSFSLPSLPFPRFPLLPPSFLLFLPPPLSFLPFFLILRRYIYLGFAETRVATPALLTFIALSG